jgi:hypothetical protein
MYCIKLQPKINFPCDEFNAATHPTDNINNVINWLLHEKLN